jgi:hypothetical protein
MKRFTVLSFLDSALVFVAACGVFVWHWRTPEYRVLKPARFRANHRSRRWR